MLRHFSIPFKFMRNSSIAEYCVFFLLFLILIHSPSTVAKKSSNIFYPLQLLSRLRENLWLFSSFGKRVNQGSQVGWIRRCPTNSIRRFYSGQFAFYIQIYCSTYIKLILRPLYLLSSLFFFAIGLIMLNNTLQLCFLYPAN